MSENQVAFDDWQAEAEKIQNYSQKQLNCIQNSDQQIHKKVQTKNENEKIDYEKRCLEFINKIKTLPQEDPNAIIIDKTKKKQLKKVQNCNHYLKSEKDFIEFGKIVSKRLLNSASGEDGIIDEINIPVFFQQILLQLYLEMDWRNIDGSKEKIKVMKKDRKQIENKAKKMRQKQQRLKRLQKNMDSTEKETDKYLKRVGEIQIHHQQAEKSIDIEQTDNLYSD